MDLGYCAKSLDKMKLAEGAKVRTWLLSFDFDDCAERLDLGSEPYRYPAGSTVRYALFEMIKKIEKAFSIRQQRTR